MITEIKVPELPESVADAVIANWYKKVGETIGVDEVLVDLETDKVILEVPALKPGMVKELLFSVGDTVTSGQLLALIDESGVVATDTNDTSPESSASDNNLAAMSPSVRKLVAEHSIDATQLVGSGKNGRIIKQDVESYISSLASKASEVSGD